MRGGRSSFAIAFYYDEAGVLTILSLLFFVMLMAAGGLSIDLGRLYGERGQMQAFVDSAALSAASQLDRSHDAMDRAACAVMGTSDSGCAASQLITGSETFSTTPGDFTVTKVTFLQSLDSSWQPTDATPAANDKVLCTYNFDTDTATGTWSASSCDTVAGNNAEAQYVEVVTAPRTVSYFLLPITDIIGKLFGASSMISEQSLSLRATAGYKQILCDNVPLMMCNPDEDVAADGGTGADFDTYDPATGKGRDDGKQIHAILQGNLGSLSPGLMGLTNVDTSDGGNNQNQFKAEFANTDPNTACTSDEVTGATGHKTGQVNQGFDVRFDEYGGGLTPSAGTAPAPNVTKGLTTKVTGGNCSNSASNTTMPFPRDNCFMAGTTYNSSDCQSINSDGTPRMGGGNWARQAYWKTMHNASLPAALASASRYEVYEYEIANNLVGSTDGQPVCYNTRTGSTASDLERRSIVLAVVNCKENAPIDSTNPVPVKAYAKIFLTEPVGNDTWNNAWKSTSTSQTVTAGTPPNTATWGQTSTADIYAEIVGIVKSGDDTGKLHQFPVLYR